MTYLLTLYALGCAIVLVAGHRGAAPAPPPPAQHPAPGAGQRHPRQELHHPAVRGRAARRRLTTVAKTTGTAARFIHPGRHRGAGLPQVRHRQRRRADRHRPAGRRVPPGRAGHRVHGGHAGPPGDQPEQADPVHDRRAVQRPRGPPRRDGPDPGRRRALAVPLDAGRRDLRDRRAGPVRTSSRRRPTPATAS